MSNKYNARKAERDGFVFSSQKEARRYDELVSLEKAGEITDLCCHPFWTMTVNGTKIGRYTADFSYIDILTGQFVVEDVKSRATRTEAYGLRKKLMLALFDITIKEV